MVHNLLISAYKYIYIYIYLFKFISDWKSLSMFQLASALCYFSCHCACNEHSSVATEMTEYRVQKMAFNKGCSVAHVNDDLNVCVFVCTCITPPRTLLCPRDACYWNIMQRMCSLTQSSLCTPNVWSRQQEYNCIASITACVLKSKL